jgi:hypothetical protein
MNDAHEWLSVDVDDDTYLFDLTFLTSTWSCIYGNGCPGIADVPAPELERGCCSHGAHLLDKADRRKVKAMAEQLTDDQWQLRDVAEAAGGPVHRNDDGDWVTRVHDGACIFHNRPGFAAGAGCALHLMALDTGQRPIDTKPAVCWQVPLRLDYHRADSGHLTYMLTEWKRRDWGEGGEEFHWWCTESPEAFGDGHGEQVWSTLRDEIVELVGEQPYAALTEHVTSAAHSETRAARGTPVTLLPHPALRNGKQA